MKLSIILPVYNVAKYIERCIASCIEQDISPADYEIIVVNDGSPDNSGALAQAILQTFPSGLYLEKSNGGLSSARNFGLEHATGEYIWFVDSDDSIVPNSLNEILSIAHEYSPDIIALTTDIVTKTGAKIINRSLSENTIYTGCEIYRLSYVYPYSGAQFYIYKREFLKYNKLNFKEGIIYEDLLFQSIALSMAEKCCYISRAVYHYYIREGSIVQSKMTPYKCQCLIEVCDDLNHFVNKSQRDEQKIVIWDSIARNAGTFYRYNWRLLPKSQEKRRLASEYFKRPYWFMAIVKARKYKYILHYIAFYINYMIYRKSVK